MAGNDQPDHSQIKELIRCGKDPVYFTKNYTRVQHPLKGAVPFKTYPYQEECLQKFKDNRFNIVLKARQLGLSTVTAAFAVWLAFFHKDKSILVIATKLPTAINFVKKVKFILKSMPAWMQKLSSFESNQQQVSFSNGSWIKAIPTSEDAGRSEALSLCIIDEAAHIKNLDELWMGLGPTLSTGGSAVLLSTPNGAHGMFYETWIGAEAGDNDFITTRLNWDVHPEHDMEWFLKETKNMDQRMINQEHMCEFVSSGDTFLKTEDLDYIRDCTCPPTERLGEKGMLWVWQRPEPDRKYIISADVSRGDAKDFSAFHVIDMVTKHVVAEYVSKVPPDTFANILYQHGRRYNDALIVVERNVYGWMTLKTLKSLKYKRIYYETAKGDIYNYVPKSESEEAKIGFDTNSRTRPLILAKLEEMIRNRTLHVKSTRLNDQLKTFIFINNRPQAARGHNDDLVMSLAIGAWFVSDEVGEEIYNTELAYAMLNATKVVSKPVEETPLAAVMGTGPGLHGQSRFNNNFVNRFGTRVQIIDPFGSGMFNAKDVLK